jgi:DNA primase
MTTSALPRIDTAQIKSSVDMIDLASHYTPLRRESRREMSGPCPLCKDGKDCFHVHVDGWWFCRKCHPKRGDVIEFVQMHEGLDFVAACESLANRTLREAPPVKPKPKPEVQRWDTERWQLRAWNIMNSAAEALDAPEGEPGRQYLQRRGISEHTWRVFVLGYSRTSPPWDKENKRWTGGPSITIPYLRHDDDRIMAVRYRRIDPSEDRYINKAGSNGKLFGLHLVDPNAPTLVIVEGELNAISIWQESHDLGISVVSTGSQTPSEQTLKAVRWLSEKFQHCIVWCDTPDSALKIRAAVKSHRVKPLQSPKVDDQKVDANDMLQSGVLRAFMERKLLGERPPLQQAKEIC